MTIRTLLADEAERRAFTLAALILMLTLCGFFFVLDVTQDISEEGLGRHIILELLASLTLCGGIALMMIELRDMLRRMDSLDRGIRAARGDMSELIDSFFSQWALTPSEREVALLILKGFDNETIARMRGVAVGTVRAQSARIYAKAGVDGRAQLFSVFMEELLADEPAETQVP